MVPARNLEVNGEREKRKEKKERNTCTQKTLNMEKDWVARFLPRENWEANIDIDPHWVVGGEGKGILWVKAASQEHFLIC